MLYLINKDFTKNKQQKGATLVTSLVFLSIMTIVSVSATKISILDVLVSSNEQQQSLLFQKAENDLKEFTTTMKLIKPLKEIDGASFSESTNAYYPPELQTPDTALRVMDKKIRYQCNGFNGKALSLGPSTPICDLYDFEAKVKIKNSGANDKHNRGAGKEKPNPLKNSYLSK